MLQFTLLAGGKIISSLKREEFAVDQVICPECGKKVGYLEEHMRSVHKKVNKQLRWSGDLPIVWQEGGLLEEHMRSVH